MAERDWVEAVLTPRDDDSSDVRWALETALAMWGRAERDQALRWLVNAVQSAKTEGAKARAEAIGRAAAELERRPTPEKRPTRPPPFAIAPGSTTQPEASEHTLPLDADAAVTHKRPAKHKTTPYKIPPDEVTNLFAPDSGLLAALRAAEPEPAAESEAISDTPVPAPVPARPRPPTVMTDGLDATLTHIRPQPPALSRDHAENTVVMDADELGAPSRSGTSVPLTVASLQNTLEPMRALRVAVKSGSGREFVLRLLDEGEAVPAGLQEAFLVPLTRKG